MLDNRILRALQMKELECVKDIALICQKYSIKWMLGYGTLLGAVRHEGFIPWDDDMDILMFKEDVDKFVEVCEKELDKEKYFLQSYETDVNHPCMSLKIRINNTCSMLRKYKDIPMNWGICIDIFTIRYAPTKKTDRKRMEFSWKLCNMLLQSSLYDSKLYDNFIKKCVIRFLQKNRTSKNIHRLIDTINNLSQKTDKKEIWIDGEIKYFPTDIFKETMSLKFEGEHFPCPIKTHECLRFSYGDYMQLPPEEERIGHGDIIVDLNKSYLEYQKELK